jgi:hypothetical protein
VELAGEGDPRAARAAGQAVRLAREIGRIGSEQGLIAYRWCAEHIAATAAAARNDPPALRDHVERGLDLAQAYQMPEPHGVGLCSLAMLARVAGRFEDAERRYAEACDQLARHGSMHADGVATLATVTIRASQRRMAEFAPAVPGVGGALRPAGGRRQRAGAGRGGAAGQGAGRPG